MSLSPKLPWQLSSAWPNWILLLPVGSSCENGGDRLRRWHEFLIAKYGLQQEMKDRKVIALPEGPWPALPVTEDMLAARISEETYESTTDVKAVFEVLFLLAKRDLRLTGKFTIPGITMIKLKKKPATKAGTQMAFRKEVFVKAKPAKTLVKCYTVKALKDAF